MITHHVEIEYCNPKTVVILVEDSFELVVQENSTLVKAQAARRIEGAALLYWLDKFLIGTARLTTSHLELLKVSNCKVIRVYSGYCLGNTVWRCRTLK